MQGDLTTLAAVREWLNTGGNAVYPPGDDPLLARLISRCSAFVISWLSVPLIPQAYTETYNGTGQPSMFLRNRPIIAVSAVSIAGVAYALSTDPQRRVSGFAFDDAALYMFGTYFPQSFQNVAVSYTAGYIKQQTVAIPSTSLPVTALSFTWTADMGVTINGLAATLVTGSPAAGQYAISEVAGVTTYAFNAADVDQQAVISYGYCPFDLEQVVIEAVGSAYKRRSRIDQASTNFGNGQVVAFSIKDFNDPNKAVLNQYKNVVPV